jgi:GT2 family glycosyltransferase
MITLSVIIVAYKNMDCLSRCLESIPELPWIEVVVVNNTHLNRGFGVGCNLGTTFANGKYVLFLNPDCVVSEIALKQLVDKLETDEMVGLLGPKLVNLLGEETLSCSKQPTRLSMPIVYSIFNRIFHNSAMVQGHWYGFFPSKTEIDVGVVSGAALMLRKQFFESIGGFDTKLFMYWEEIDLARRILAGGKRVIFTPQVCVIHEGEQSTASNDPKVKKWFNDSRYRYMKKYFGVLYAMLIEFWFTLLEEWRLVLGIIALITFGLGYYLSGWWFNYSQIWAWHTLIDFSPLSMTSLYWLGLVGAVMGMISIFNELEIQHRWVAVLTSLIAGLLFIAISPFGALLTVVGGFLWCVTDLVQSLSKWRKWVIILLLISSICVLGLFGWKLIRYQGFSAPLKDWQTVASLIIRKYPRFGQIHCLGCTVHDELWPLDIWLQEFHAETNVGGEVIYVSLPSYSSADTGVINTIRYKVGQITLSMPMKNL